MILFGNFTIFFDLCLSVFVAELVQPSFEEGDNMLKFIQMQRKAKARQKEIEVSTPKKGDVAPDFHVYDVNSDRVVSLSSFKGKKPVALIFGSFT